MPRRTLGSAARRTRPLALVWLLWLAVPAWGAVPGQINFQGLLLDSSGQPVNGAVSLMFTLYDAETNGIALWTESHTGVQVLDGVYDVALGSLTPIAADVLAAGSVWVEVKVGAETLTPRKQVLAVPYALRAEMAETAKTAKSADSVATPPTPPVIGFLKIDGIDGSADQATYPNHPNEVVVRAFSWGASQSGSLHTGGGGGAGQVDVQDLSLTIDSDKAVTPLFLLMSTGAHISDMTLDIGPPGNPDADSTLHRIKLEKVIVSSISTRTPLETEELTTVNVTFHFAKVTVDSNFKDSNSVVWNVETKKGTGTDYCGPGLFIFPGDSLHDFSKVPEDSFISDMSWGGSHSGSFHAGGGGGSGEVRIQDMSLELDYRGPCFFGPLASGVTIPQIRLEFWSAASDVGPHTKILLEPALITSFSLGGLGDHGQLVQKVTINFAEVTVETFNATGESTGTYHWNIQTNTS